MTTAEGGAAGGSLVSGGSSAPPSAAKGRRTPRPGFRVCTRQPSQMSLTAAVYNRDICRGRWALTNGGKANIICTCWKQEDEWECRRRQRRAPAGAGAQAANGATASGLEGAAGFSARTTTISSALPFAAGRIHRHKTVMCPRIGTLGRVMTLPCPAQAGRRSRGARRRAKWWTRTTASTPSCPWRGPWSAEGPAKQV